MEEAQAATVRISGICNVLSGESFNSNYPPAAYVQLSDHCPLIVDIEDRDLD